MVYCYKLRSLDVGGHFWFIVLKFLSKRRRHMRLDGKVSASVDFVSRVPQSNALELMFIFYTIPHC